jgi:tryptophan-rich sensory protein
MGQEKAAACQSCSVGEGDQGEMNRAASGFGLVGWIAVCFLAASVGSLFTARSVGTWYVALAKPSWTPPSWLFGPVWTVLYLLMGAAAWLVWRREGLAAAAGPLSLFLAQLALNAAWSFLFFGLRRPDLAFGEIVLLWCLIIATTVSFWSKAPSAGALMLPYLAWVTFASGLTFAIWGLNA